MSTATEEPPKTEAPVTPTPEARKAEAQAFLRPKVQVDGVTSQAPEPVKAKEEAAPTKVETPPVAEAKVDPKEQSIAELRKSRDEERKQREQFQKDLEAERAERARIAAEYEEHKKKPASEDFLKKHQELEAERNKLDQELRASALERSPSFIRDYQEPINRIGSSMVEMMVASGVERPEAIKAINTWNEDRFAEYAEGMPAGQKMKFQAAWMEAERIELVRKQELSNANESYKKREAAAQEQQKAQMDQHQQFLKSEEETMFRELFSTEGLKDNAALQQAAREAVAASYQMQPRELMHRVATARIFADAVLMKDKEITDQKTKITELEAKLAEQEMFIKNANGATAKISPTDPAEKPEDRKARAQSFLNPTVVAQ